MRGWRGLSAKTDAVAIPSMEAGGRGTVAGEEWEFTDRFRQVMFENTLFVIEKMLYMLKYVVGKPRVLYGPFLLRVGWTQGFVINE